MASKKFKSKRINEAIGVVLLLLGLYSLLSLLFFHPTDFSFYTSNPNETPRNVMGVLGVYLSHYLRFTFGLSALCIPVLLLFWAVCYFLQKVPSKKWFEGIGILVAITSVATIASLSVQNDWRIDAGGVIGYFIASNLETYFGVLGGLIVALCCLVLSLILATDFLLYPLLERAWENLVSVSAVFFTSLKHIFAFFNRSGTEGDRVRTKRSQTVNNEAPRRFFAPKVKKYGQKESDDTALPESKVTKVDAEAKQEQKLKDIRSNLVKNRRKEQDRKEREQHGENAPAETPQLPELTPDKYMLPLMEFLRPSSAESLGMDDDLHENSRILEETLSEFGVEAKVVAVEQGPVITRYELLPAPGVKITRIVSLSDDLALALKAASIRMIAPIPGKSAVGIEIPNSKTAIVCLRELMESKDFKSNKFKLPLLLGKDTSGKTLIADLTNMPHLLIAGTTGSGKTVCVNSVISGLLYTRAPSELKFVMIDPKMVELAPYKDIPHMLTPVVTDAKKAAATLNWIVNEMEKRYQIFAVCGTRNIEAYNSRPDLEPADKPEGMVIPEKLPYIVVIIDELADLMLIAQDKVETAITRLAQLSRAVGIHLLLATQRPSVDVITGVIKANFPARISFKVASKVDSRTVLDMNGADKLLGKGDMLFLEPGQPKPVRGQAALITDQEIEKIVMFLKKQQQPQYNLELSQIQSGVAVTKHSEKDELYDEAVRVVLETRQASVSVLQRKLRLGYGRAARIIDMMEEEGIVGPHQGSKPRDILVDHVDEPTQESIPESS